MNKKSLIILIVAIIIFVIAVGIFFYAKNVIKPGSTETNIPAQNNAEGFVFYDENNNKFDMGNFEGMPIALVLWSSDTENSFEIIEMLDQIYDDYKDSVNFLIINTNELNDDIVKTISECGYSLPIYYDFDNLASNYYSYLKLPTLIFIEADGTISNQIEAIITEDSLLANLDLISGNY